MFFKLLYLTLFQVASGSIKIVFGNSMLIKHMKYALIKIKTKSSDTLYIQCKTLCVFVYFSALMY